MTQYGIYWVTLDPTQGCEIAKTRPCVVVSPNEINRYLNTVIIVPLTSKIRNLPFRVNCIVSGKNGELVIDQVRAVDKVRIDSSKNLGILQQKEISNLQKVFYEMLCK